MLHLGVFLANPSKLDAVWVGFGLNIDTPRFDCVADSFATRTVRSWPELEQCALSKPIVANTSGRLAFPRIRYKCYKPDNSCTQMFKPFPPLCQWLSVKQTNFLMKVLVVWEVGNADLEVVVVAAEHLVK